MNRKLKTRLVQILLFVSPNALYAQTGLDFFLPKDVEYSESIPTPESVIGHEIGHWHLTHDKLLHYFQELGRASERVKIEVIGKTYEKRPLLNVIVTSSKNHSKLDEIKEEHIKISDPDQMSKLSYDQMPVVVRLGYSVHGNEASGANAAVVVGYYLAAAKGKEIDDLLDNTIILIDPSLNPDGMQRYASWVNQHKSKNLVSDPNSREFHESWPNGRTNHYWFDLNRDWLLVQHPESQARLNVYHEWMPNVQTDHHEMMPNSSFFFQPGIASRKNPHIPAQNVRLTEKIAEFHAQALDEQKRLYYSGESFDDFYFGKGSTYPDIQGSIGILFEQATVRGHLRESSNGLMSFKFAIKNHFTVSMSTLEAALKLKHELLSFQCVFFESTKKFGKHAVVVGVI